MLDQLKILLRVYVQPAKAFGAALDSGSIFFAAIGAGIVAAAMGSLTSLAPVAFLFAPVAVIIAASWLGRGSMGVALQRDYAPMLVCALMAWTAAHLLILPMVWLAPQFLGVAQIAAIAYFAILSAFAIQAVAGASVLQGIVTAVAACAIAVGGYFAWDQIGGIQHIFLSPFVLIMLYPVIRSYVDGFGNGLRSRQNFRRNLEASTLNPHDGDAQYQLGLIYQERRNYTEAVSRFSKAAQIDPEDPGAHYQLGVIAREQGRLEEALAHIARAHAIDPKHSSGEVVRDLGATNFQLGKLEESRLQLESYTERREYDPQGLYWLGRAYKSLQRTADARSVFERAIEAANTAPPHLRRQAAKWGSQSRSEMRSL